MTVQEAAVLCIEKSTKKAEKKLKNEMEEIKMKKSVITSYDELPLLLNVKQLTDLLGVSESSVYELIQEDDFPSLRIGKRIVVPKEELRKWITAHTKGAKEC